MRRLALIGMLPGAPVLSQGQANPNSWEALNTFHAGQKIEVVETNLKKHKGELSTLTDEAIGATRARY